MPVVHLPLGSPGSILTQFRGAKRHPKPTHLEQVANAVANGVRRPRRNLNGFFRVNTKYISGRTIPPWIKWPNIDVKIYFPRLVTSTMMSFISTILLPTRNVMPTGTYLGHEHRVLVSKSDVMKVLGGVGPSWYRTQALSTRWSSFLPQMTLRNRKGWAHFTGRETE